MASREALAECNTKNFIGKFFATLWMSATQIDNIQKCKIIENEQFSLSLILIPSKVKTVSALLIPEQMDECIANI